MNTRLIIGSVWINRLYMFSYYLDIEGFSQAKNKWCYPSYGSHTKRINAILACREDEDCHGVWDNSCDDEGEFKLCNRNSIETADWNTCVYRKGTKNH